jgi:hypothetical protein
MDDDAQDENFQEASPTQSLLLLLDEIVICFPNAIWQFLFLQKKERLTREVSSLTQKEKKSLFVIQ